MQILSEAMRRALDEAAHAMQRGEVPVGAAITDPEGRIVAADGNRTLELRDPTAHAEMLVIREACRLTGAERLTGHDLYVSLEPCTMCAAAISFARIRRLYFGAGDPKMGAVEHGARVFTLQTCHHAPEVYGGLSEKPAADLLRRFFEARR
jgi:cytidine deaminase